MLEDGGDTFTVLVRLRRVDGKITPYRLLVDAAKPKVRVREKEPKLLPTWCPELHINDGGWFCLGYGDDAPGPVTDPQTADQWWGIVISVLRLQERARALKRWPNGNVWAHGGAAGFQSIAEEMANAISSELWAALRNGLIVARKHSKRSVRVMAGAGRLYSIWDGEKTQVVNLKRPCLCGSGKPMKKCGNHAKAAAMLALALAGMERATAGFWKHFKEQPCCGKSTTCPLQDNKEAAKAA